MRYGSVCSGIEAATMAWHPLGWEPVFFSEIEPFPCSVLAHHYPDVPNHGDMTKFSEWPDHAIDLLVGGTPCQSFSIAGLRAGLADPRGNLMLTYLAIAARRRPQWLVWENVPGVLSSNRGRDFGTFLRGLAELGYGFAYRVLDAQFVRTRGFEHAVPQSRRRVFVIGHLGDWRPAAAVLFDGESLRGCASSSEDERQDVAPRIGVRPSLRPWPARVASTITAAFGEKLGLENQHIFSGAPLFVLRDGNIRRLTPTEFERLQGFPDGWTVVPHRNKPAADGPRYKALGNSMAVNVMRWIGERIDMVDKKLAASVNEEAA